VLPVVVAAGDAVDVALVVATAFFRFNIIKI
jgi:hypothetical protein